MAVMLLAVLTQSVQAQQQQDTEAAGDQQQAPRIVKKGAKISRGSSRMKMPRITEETLSSAPTAGDATLASEGNDHDASTDINSNSNSINHAASPVPIVRSIKNMKMRDLPYVSPEDLKIPNTRNVFDSIRMAGRDGKVYTDKDLNRDGSLAHETHKEFEMPRLSSFEQRQAEQRRDADHRRLSEEQVNAAKHSAAGRDTIPQAVLSKGRKLSVPNHRYNSCEEHDCPQGGCSYVNCDAKGGNDLPPVSCTGGGCTFFKCEQPSCSGGNCKFISCANPSCDGGACDFVDTKTVLVDNYCAGGRCTIDGFEVQGRASGGAVF